MLDALHSAFASPLWVTVTGVATLLSYLTLGSRFLRKTVRSARGVSRATKFPLGPALIALLILAVYGWYCLGTVMMIDAFWVHPEVSDRWENGGSVQGYLPLSTTIPATAMAAIIHAAFLERAARWFRETPRATPD